MAKEDVNSLFEQLLEFKWKGVPFPTSGFTLDLRHDLAHHKYPERDGENIEATGRAALHFTASIPFLNGIVPGKTETWGILYPTGYRAFMEVAKEGSTGLLVHPEFGPISAKLEGCRSTWSGAQHRDGVMVECTWVETFPEGATNSGFLQGQASPISAVLLGALDLDAHLGTITPPFPKLPIYKPDFAAFMRSITAVTDQIGLASQRGAGRIGAVLYRLDALETSINVVAASPKTTAKNILSPITTAQATSCLLWPIRRSIDLVRGASHDLNQVLGTNGRRIKVFRPPIDMTLAAAAQNIRVSVAEVLTLNPEASAQVFVRAMTPIRYYADSQAAA